MLKSGAVFLFDESLGVRVMRYRLSLDSGEACDHLATLNFRSESNLLLI